MGGFAVLASNVRMIERNGTSSQIEKVAEDNAEKARQAGYLCGNCADRLGGTWPRGHRASSVTSRCPLCGDCRSLTSWDDWNWPKAQRTNRIAMATREV